jgi:nucleotide-binding universal stress UspA family protein
MRTSQARRQPAGTVVCALTGAERDQTMVDLSGALARATGTDLEVMLVTAPPVFVGGAGAALVHPPLVPSATDERALRSHLSALVDDAGFPTARVETTSGPAETILEEISARPDVRWMVVEDHGGGALRAAFEASLARRLLTHASCPVVLAPGGATAATLDGAQVIVCAVADTDEGPATASLAGALARDLGVRLVVVHAVAEGRFGATSPRRAREAEELLDRCLATVPANVEARAVAVVGPELDGLLEAMHDERAGIVVVGAPHHGLARSAIGGSVCHAVLANLEWRLAVVAPPPDEQSAAGATAARGASGAQRTGTR